MILNEISLISYVYFNLKYNNNIRHIKKYP